MNCLMLELVVPLVSVPSALKPRLKHMVLYAPRTIGWLRENRCGRRECMQERKWVVTLPRLLLQELNSYGALQEPRFLLGLVSAILLLNRSLLLLTMLAAQGRCLVDSMEPLS